MVFCCVTLGKKTFLQTLKIEGKHAKCHAKKVCQLLAYSADSYDETPYLRSCNCNSESAKPPNPRYQVQPGNQILEPLALVGCKI
jgi:hypothetical protein